jgi:hypothetical protein
VDDGTDADLAALVGAVMTAFPPEVAAYFRPGYATHVLAGRIADGDSPGEAAAAAAAAAAGAAGGTGGLE